MRTKTYAALPPSLAPRLLDRATAAAYCGVSVNHFLAHVPVAPFDGFGTKRLWDRAAIDQWLDGSDHGPDYGPGGGLTAEEWLERA